MSAGAVNLAGGAPAVARATAAAVLSMLHEGPPPKNSAARRFRGQAVLAWTLGRLRRARAFARGEGECGGAAVVVVCWSDQIEEVRPIADANGAHVLMKTPRTALPNLELVSAAQRWSDGWRGGLLGTCHFDRGFHAPYVKEVIEHVGTACGGDAEDAAALLVDPAAALIDPDLVDALLAHAGENPELDLVFTQAAPGLAGAVVRGRLVSRLAGARGEGGGHPGRLLSYWPDTPGRDPITGSGCLAVPAPAARTVHRFTVDSERQAWRLTRAMAGLNGQLVATDARGLVGTMDAHAGPDPLPRELVLEINTARAGKPIYAPGTHLSLGRGDMPVEMAGRVIAQAARADDLRLTLGGCGDPLLHPRVRHIVEAAHAAGLRAVHLETDLLGVAPETIDWLARSPVDVVSVHMPAATLPTYRRVMGADGLAEAMENLKRFLGARRGGLPIVVPTFTKCVENLDEMEAWYDHWLRVLGAAVIVGPSDCAGQVPDVGCADMSPARRPCARLDSRMTVLSDGTVPSCEQDVLGRQPMGHVAEADVGEIWRRRMAAIRAAHRCGELQAFPLCARCKEWHRP